MGVLVVDAAHEVTRELHGDLAVPPAEVRSTRARP